MKCAATYIAGITLAMVCGIPTSLATQLPPPLPPYQGAYQPVGVDEIGLWHQDDEDERKLAASPLIIRDEKLVAYVKSVLCETVGNDRCNSTRIYIVRTSQFNASMSPNGTMRVLSGLFLRVHNEAELGAVLGHEFGHFERRHTLNHFKAARSSSDFLAWAAVLAAAAPSNAAIQNYRNIEVSIYGNLYRYDRNQEREADITGISYLNQSQLRPQAAATFWENVMAEGEASASARGLQKPNFKAIAFTASHPPEAERASYLKVLAQPDAGSREDGGQRYRENLAEWLPRFMSDQIKLNDFGASEYLIKSWAAYGWTDWLWEARGDLYRGRGTPRDLSNAAEFYGNAVALNSQNSTAYRGLGLSLMKSGEPSKGRIALARYLELKPDAPDAGMIRMMLSK